MRTEKERKILYFVLEQLLKKGLITKEESGRLKANIAAEDETK